MRQRRTAERRAKGRAVSGNLAELAREVASLPALDMPPYGSAGRRSWATLQRPTGDAPC